jgi:hypothetical protein
MCCIEFSDISYGACHTVSYRSNFGWDLPPTAGAIFFFGSDEGDTKVFPQAYMFLTGRSLLPSPVQVLTRTRENEEHISHQMDSIHEINAACMAAPRLDPV